jgi:ABC-type amino acid transport substrate-binding protein
MKKQTFLFLVILILSAALAYSLGTRNPAVMQAGAKETTYDRVLRTGEIRCAYAPYAPALIKDPNTGKLSGIFYDVMTEVGHRLNLKINWVEEVGYGVIPEGFATDRYDAFCNTVWPTAERSRVGSFTVPLYYSPAGVFVRSDEHRFDGNLDKLNDPAIRFSGRDGDISASFAAAAFPNAKIVSIPQLADTAQTLDDVAHGKADATINEPSLLYLYLEKNPGTLRDIAADHPIRVSPNTIMMKPNEYQFKVMLDTSLQELINSGFVDKAIQKYQKYPAFLRTNLPYQPNSPPIK